MDLPLKPVVAKESPATEMAKSKAAAKPMGRLGPLLLLLLLVANMEEGRATHPAGRKADLVGNTLRRTWITLGKSLVAKPQEQ